MPDPIASSSLLASSSDDMCGFGDNPALTCQTPAAPIHTTDAAEANSCVIATVPGEPTLSSAASRLAQKFSNTNHAVFIAASSPSSVPSAPSALNIEFDQVNFQTGIPRFESHAALGDLHLNASVDLLNANVHVGSSNEDGSHGENVGAGANLLSGELTLEYKGWSLSVGAGASAGGSIASGAGRDLDADGALERCFRMSLGTFTLGECDEL